MLLSHLGNAIMSTGIKCRNGRKISAARIIAAVQRDDYSGFCRACGESQGGCEPDARGYECESCGEHAVYGAEELLFHVVG